MTRGGGVPVDLGRGVPMLGFAMGGASGPSRALCRISGSGEAAKMLVWGKDIHDLFNPPGAQRWSPMFEMGISMVQFEHLIVGRKLDGRVVDAMFASLALPSRCSRNVFSVKGK